MDKNLPTYDSTTLKKVFFNEEEFENELTFSFKVTKSIHESEDQETKENLIVVEGKLNAENPEGDVATSINMETIFKSDEIITEDDLEEIDEEYIMKPLFNEITMLLGILTGKAFKVPIILPPFNTEEVLIDEEETED